METHIVVDGHLTVSEGHRIAKAVESCLEEKVDTLYPDGIPLWAQNIR